MAEVKREIQLVTRIVGPLAAAAGVHGVSAETPAETDARSCCVANSSRGALLATATAEANSVSADRTESLKTSAPSISTKGWPAKPWPEGMVWIPGGEFAMGAAMNGPQF